MKNVLDILKERGYIKQIVFEEELYKLLGSESVTFYIGFDPTADSLHIGHFLQLIVSKIMQDCGHKPIMLIGGGTAMVGDPSGRTDMRSMMTKEIIAHNSECFKKQMSKFLNFKSGKNAAVMVNNADWLLNLNYVDFLRDVGTHFSVNRMLTADCFKARMEKGLSFLEFNYMPMQSYDFLVLNQKYGCALQLGGDDQWSNILSGADLIRRKAQKDAFAMTFTLLTTSEGIKMGKTAKGAIWLDENKTTPYEFFQYFRNIDDADVENCLKLLTALPLDEIAELTKYKDERMNAAKEKLAYYLTSLVHGREKADGVLAQVKAAFSGAAENMPEAEISKNTVNILDILVETKICASKGEARRLVDGGGISINDVKIDSQGYALSADIIKSGSFILHKGKKVHLKVILK